MLFAGGTLGVFGAWRNGASWRLATLLAAEPLEKLGLPNLQNGTTNFAPPPSSAREMAVARQSIEFNSPRSRAYNMRTDRGRVTSGGKREPAER